jgi:broad specificity phosphatase PhoE
MRIFFARHGESEANLLRVFSNHSARHPLTARGVAQVEELAEQLADVQFAGIFCSPLLRATQTAALLAEKLGCSYSVTHALVEYDVGILEGRSDPEAWDLYSSVREAWLVEQQWHARIEGGESLADIKNRFVPFIEHLVEQYYSTDASLLLVGHGGTFSCMLPLVLANVDHAFVLDHPFGNCACVVAERHGNQLVCLRWCEVEMPEASER